MLFVDRRWVSRSGRERVLGFVRSIDAGRVLGRVRSVSVIQAIRSRTHRTDPASAFITSEGRQQRAYQEWRANKPGSSSGDDFSLFGPATFMFAAMVTSTTIFRTCRTTQANLPANVRGWNSPLNPREF